MKVLLTRPEGRNQDMMEQLDKLNMAYLVAPLLHVSATNHPIPLKQISSATGLIFISTNAVEYAANLLNGTFPKNLAYFAVGDATKAALAAYHISAITAPESAQDSEGLISLSELNNIKNQSFIIIRGVGGRESIAETLISRGASITYWEVYQRSIPNRCSAADVTKWNAFGIDTIIVTSGEILSNLINLVPKELFAWLGSCHIIVPSHRVKLQAQAFGLSHVTNANGANTKAILASFNK